MSSEAHRFKPGQSGNPGGKTRIRIKRVDEVLAFEGLHPVTEIIRLINEGDLHDRDKLRAWFELLPYVQAQLKPVEDKPDDSPLQALSTLELVQLVNEKLPGQLVLDLPPPEVK